MLNRYPLISLGGGSYIVIETRSRPRVILYCTTYHVKKYLENLLFILTMHILICARAGFQSKSPSRSGLALGSWEPLRQNGNLGCFGFGGSAPPPASASASSTSSSIASCSYEPQHQLQLGQTGPGWRGRRHARVHTATHSFTSFQLTCWLTALSGPGVSGVGT